MNRENLDVVIVVLMTVGMVGLYCLDWKLLCC